MENQNLPKDPNGELKHLKIRISWNDEDMDESNAAVKKWTDKGWSHVSYLLALNEKDNELYIIHTLRFTPQPSETKEAVKMNAIKQISRLLTSAIEEEL